MVSGKEVYRSALLISIVCFALSACSSADVEPEAVEVPTTQAPIDDAPEAVLFERGKRLYLAGHYLVARDAFESLKNAYPLSPYAEFSEIKLADSDFEMKKYMEAAVQYESLLKSRPSSQARNYLLVMAARSNQLANRGVGRDTEPLVKAQGYAQKALSEFPGSPYESAAKKVLGSVELLIAENEALIAEFYKENKKITAYNARVSAFEKAWGTRDIDEFLTVARSSSQQEEQPIEADADGDPEAAPPVLVVAQATTQEPFALLPANTQGDAGTRASLGRPGSSSEAGLDLSAQAIERIDCKSSNSGEMVVIYLRSELKESDSEIAERIKADEKTVSIPLGLPFSENEYSCREGRTLSSLKNGTLLVDGSAIPELLTLNHPPRLVLNFPEKN